MRTARFGYTRYWLLLVVSTIFLSLDALAQQQEPMAKVVVAASLPPTPTPSVPILLQATTPMKIGNNTRYAYLEFTQKL